MTGRSDCQELNEPELRCLKEHDSEQARQWNLLSDLRPDMLRYVSNPPLGLSGRYVVRPVGAGAVIPVTLIVRANG